MNGIVLQATAIGIGRRGAYTRYFKVKDTFKDPLGFEHTVSSRKQQDVPACETVIFKCPAPKCGAKNEQSILSAKGNAGEELIFHCRKCDRQIQVSKPNEIKSIIIPGITKPEHVGLIGPDGRALR